jgi:molybdopterin molybdotransferase
MAEPITIDEARARVLAAVTPLGAEQVPLAAALGRVLAEPVESGFDVPPFDASAMDGYAVAEGAEGELRVVGEARAGAPASARVEQGAAVRISTGAQVPEGTGAVVPVERVDESDGHVSVPAIGPGANVRRAGEDMRAGQRVLEPGRVIGPAEAGVIASLGLTEVACGRRPRVALLVTGDELVEPGTPLAPGQIYSSNAPALAGQVAAAGADLAFAEHVGDDAGATGAAVGRALDAAEVLIVSGGVSVGPHDHVKGALAEHGVGERFWGVSMRPGKPTWFGARGARLAFGLPGNPVSAMVTFHLFARPALRALQGADPGATRARAVLDSAVARHEKRAQAVRVRLRAGDGGWHAEPTGPQGSHQLTSMLGAAALALIGPGAGEIGAGEVVEVELLDSPAASPPAISSPP